MKLPKGAGWKVKSFWTNSYVFVWPGRSDVTDTFPTIPCRCGLKQILKFLEHQNQLMSTCDCLGEYRKVFQQFLINNPNCLDKPKSDTKVVVFF